MKQRLASPGPQRGLTLVELMVAVAIALFLCAAVAGVYVSAKGILRHENALARMQSDARLGLAVMGQAVRNAGFTGCSTALSGAPPVLATPNVLGAHWNLLDPIGIRRGQSGGWQSFDADIPAQALAASDVLRTVGTATHKSLSQLGSNDVIVASDCSQTYVARFVHLESCTAPAGSGISGFSPAGQDTCGLDLLKRDARVLPAANDLFFIGRLQGSSEQGGATGLIHCSSSLITPEPEDFKANDLSCRMLAEGAVDLKIEAIYGPVSAAVEQRAPGPDEFWNTAASQGGKAAPESSPIRAVEVRLLMASAPGMGALSHAPQSYAFYRDGNGEPVRSTAADRRLYREFSAVFTLRNRVE